MPDASPREKALQPGGGWRTTGDALAAFGWITFAICVALFLLWYVHGLKANGVSGRIAVVTNPDAPLLRWATSPDANGRSIVPVLFGNPPRWNPAQPQFNRYFDLRFLQATRNAAGQCAVTIENGQPVDIPGDQAGAAIHAVAGANTNYVLHAEELLADNFSQLMMGKTVPNPEVHARLAAFLGVPVG